MGPATTANGLSPDLDKNLGFALLAASVDPE